MAEESFFELSAQSVPQLISGYISLYNIGTKKEIESHCAPLSKGR